MQSIRLDYEAVTGVKSSEIHKHVITIKLQIS